MLLKDTSLDQVFRNVRADILELTNNGQRPIEASQLTGEAYYLVKTDYEKILASQLDLNNWTKRPLSFMVRDDIDDTLHPTPKGHQIIAAELTREFKRINGSKDIYVNIRILSSTSKT